MTCFNTPRVYAQEYELPQFKVLANEGVQQIDVKAQRIHTLEQWNDRLIVDSTDRTVALPKLVSRYFINGAGYVDSIMRWDSDGNWLFRVRLVYDEKNRYTEVHQDDSSGRSNISEYFEYTDSGIIYEKQRKGKWVRNFRTDADTLLVRDHIRNAQDSGYYAYDPEEESITSVAFRDGDLAYRNRFQYIMKDGKPDSLYMKNEYYLPAFETYQLEGAPPVIEGKVDVLPNGEAIVPEYSPLSVAVSTGFSFGEHRTKTNLPRPKFYSSFQATTLVEQSNIWPTFITPNHIERVYYIIEYKRR